MTEKDVDAPEAQKSLKTAYTIKEFNNFKDGDSVSFIATFAGMAVRLSPPLKLVQAREGKEVEVGAEVSLFDVNIEFVDGILATSLGGDKKIVIEFFEKCMAFLNILGLPFDFVTESDVLGRWRFPDGTLNSRFSSKADRRGYGIEPIKISVLEFASVVNALVKVWKNFKNNSVSSMGDVYIFLGYSRYYYFYEDYLLSFVNGFIFLEGMIDHLWVKMIASKYQKMGNNPLDSGKDWTLRVKIDELFMMGLISNQIRTSLHSLRKKRNEIFHADKNPEKRIVNKKDAFVCIQMTLFLFYKNLDMLDTEGIIDLQKIREKISKEIHEARFFRE